MSVLTSDLSRRDFLKSSAAVGGGLILALGLPGCSGGKPTAALGSAAGGQPNAWLKIGGDNSITVFVDRSEMGQGVYTALTQLLAEELELKPEAVKIEAAPAGDAYINNLLGTQITGGSTSVRDAWEKLRLAGAQARSMLIAAAAKQWGVDESQCGTRDGVIFNARKDQLSFGDVAEAAAKLPVPKDVKLKPPSAFKVVGKSQPRLDTPSKVDGRATYGIDVKLPGMLYAALAQSPVIGGKLRTVDASAAEAMPDVVKVLPVDDGVVVIAQHFWQALKARDALKLDWDRSAGATLDNAAILATLKNASGKPGATVRADGDAARALGGAKKVVTAAYELPLLAHATLEPQNCTADVQADGCDVYVGTQVQIMAQAAAAAAAGLKPEQVRVHTTLLGGGFGRRLDVDYIPAAVKASKAVGKPVKLIWTREDDTTHDVYRPPAYDEVSAGFDAQGKLIAWHLHLTGPSVTARMFPSVVEKMIDPFAIEAAANYPYDVPNVLVQYLPQEVGVTVGYWRSVSHALNCFVAESFMDELAAATRQDPYEFRKALLSKPRFQRVLDEAAGRAAWGKAAKGRHQGIALMEGYGTHLAQVVEISMHGNRVKIHKIVCVVDCGRMVNPRIVESQIESGIVFGLTAALWGEITIERGAVQQKNFDTYRLLRSNEMPPVEVYLLDSEENPGGIGEPSTALVAPALCNAIFAATGKRIRKLPIASAGFGLLGA